MLDRLEQGDPLPLTATLLYFAAPGSPAEGRLLAYDRISVGGLGLSSASIERITLPVPRPAPAGG